jgi:hypothetical protein
MSGGFLVYPFRSRARIGEEEGASYDKADCFRVCRDSEETNCGVTHIHIDLQLPVLEAFARETELHTTELIYGKTRRR